MKPYALFLASLFLVTGQVLADPPVRIQATPSLMALAKDLVRPAEQEGIEVKVIEEAGNSQVVGDLGEGQIDVALITRPLTIDERVSYPARHFVEATLGVQAVAVVVSRAIWDSGIHALDRKQIADAYENRARNWKDLGGEDRPLLFFEPVHDRGPWEIFAAWLYGDLHKAPAVAWQTVADGPDTQTTLQFASGAISVAGIHWADRKEVFPLAVIGDDGKAIEPTIENIAKGTYPLARPVMAVFGKDPAAQRKKFYDFLVGEKGQKVVAAHDFLAQSDLKPSPTP
jgi:phosphate transport system substrate-binding protein